MNNDLISRDALKKALKSNCKPELCHDYNSAWCEACCPHNDFEDLIDEAPTVEYTFEEAFQKTVCENKLYCPARPQGEWQEPFESNGKTYHKCTHCHISSELILFGNYCPNCGALMKKEATT